MDSLIESIKSRAYKLDFDDIGFCEAKITKEVSKHLKEFVLEGRHGSMNWIADTLDRRSDPKNMWKNADGAFDYLIVRTTALIAAAFMIRTKDATSELAQAMVEEYEQNIELLNTGRAALGFQNTGDASKGIIRDVTYTDGALRPVDLKGTASMVDFDLIQVYQ